MHFDRERKEKFSREGCYLYGKLTFNTLLCSFAAQGDDPIGFIAPSGGGGPEEGRPGIETLFPVGGVRLEGVCHR